MHLFTALAIRFAPARHRQPVLPRYPRHGRPVSVERGSARSPAHDEIGRRPGQVSWLVARAVTLQYR